MPTFRRKPQCVEAVQIRELGQRCPSLCYERFHAQGRRKHKVGFAVPHVHTPDGVEYVEPGEWVVTDHKGMHRVYTDDAFRQAFEPADDGAVAAFDQPAVPEMFTEDCRVWWS